MKIQLDGFTAEINRIYAYKTYAGLLAGVIDTNRNDYEEAEAQNELKKFSTYVKNSLYLSPLRMQRKLSSFSNEMRQIIKEDFEDGFYNDENVPEEKLASFWVFVELTSYDVIIDSNCIISGLNIACNIKDFEIRTIETCLLNRLKLDVWEREATDVTS